MKELFQKEDERELKNKYKAAFYAMSALPMIYVVLSSTLAYQKEMTAFFAVTFLFVVQQLGWIISFNVMNHRRYDGPSVICWLIFIFLILTGGFAIWLTEQPIYLFVFVLALPFGIYGTIRTNRLN